MPASLPPDRAPNRDQFFHGTTHAIRDGVVRPADVAGKNVSDYSFGDPGDMSEGDHAFAVRNHEAYAWHAARTFHPNGRRARVYEVTPPKDIVPGPWNKEHPDFLHHVEYGDPEEYPPHENPEAYHEALKEHQDEWASKTGFPVRKRIDIMPGRQGTFPTFNWNRFAPNRLRGKDLNHPTDLEVHSSVNPEPSPEKPVEPRLPARRTGASLRAFMEGRPEPPPPPEPTLF